MTIDAAHRRPRTARELYDSLPDLEPFRVQVLEGRLIAHRIGPPEHALSIANLAETLSPLRARHGWRGGAGGVMCMAGSREPVVPDYVLAPEGCPWWRNAELLSSGVIMAAEVVSEATLDDDRQVKRRVYARGGVPVYLLIDPLDDPPSVTVFSDAGGGVYGAMSRVVMGDPIRLPQPIDLELDTSIFAT